MRQKTKQENQKVIYECQEYKIYAEEAHPLSDKELAQLVKDIDIAREDDVPLLLLISAVVTVLLIFAYLIFKM